MLDELEAAIEEWDRACGADPDMSVRCQSAGDDMIKLSRKLRDQRDEYKRQATGYYHEAAKALEARNKAQAELAATRRDIDKAVYSRVEHWRSSVEALQAQLTEAQDLLAKADAPYGVTIPEKNQWSERRRAALEFRCSRFIANLTPPD